MGCVGKHGSWYGMVWYGMGCVGKHGSWYGMVWYGMGCVGKHGSWYYTPKNVCLGLAKIHSQLGTLNSL